MCSGRLFSVLFKDCGRSSHERGKNTVGNMLNLNSGCQVWSLPLTMPEFLLVGGQIGDSVVIPAEGGPYPMLVYAGLLEVNKVSVFSAVFAAPQRAIRALV